MENRYERQSDLVNLDAIKHLTLTIIGVGAIGRQVALQASAMGIPNIQLVDFDTVEDVNLSSQGFREKDLGKLKVEAVAEACQEMNSEIVISTRNEPFNPQMVEADEIVMCCVDDIGVRKTIFADIHKSVKIWIDGRMTAEAMRVITAHTPATMNYYNRTLFEKSEATPGRCTAKSTIYCASVAAGFMLSQLTRILRGCMVEKDVILNLFTSTMEYDIDDKAKKAA